MLYCMRLRLALLSILLAAAFLLVRSAHHRAPLSASVARANPPSAKRDRPPSSRDQPNPQPEAKGASSVPDSELSYIVIGGGATPQTTEVSLEQNLALAEQVLHGSHVLLFAGGQDSRSVRLADDQPPSDPLLVRLGTLFQPHTTHQSRFRPTSLRVSPASFESVEVKLVSALSRGERPLLVYVAGHGQQGEEAKDNAVVLWGGRSLSVAHLAQLHDAHPRPLRFVSASCFSGGFAELAFAGADPKRGPTRAPRCGLFAGTWDRETSGCDPDPDRRKQEGYSLHFLQALAGRDRDGNSLPLSSLDLDGDGAVSLLEAHVRAAIAGRSIDVPTTTSERLLRSLQSKQGAPDFALLPEQAAVVKQLGARLGLDDQAATQRRWAAIDRELRAQDERLNQADDNAQSRFGELSAALLARWPVLDDAYHPDFATTLAHDRKAIAEALSNWPEAQRYATAQQAFDTLDAQSQELELQEAQLTRLMRAYETLGLAAALHRRGGPGWARYQELLACERFVPPR
jgi:hypothetical protein